MDKRYKSNDGNIISNSNNLDMDDCKLYLFIIIFLIRK